MLVAANATALTHSIMMAVCAEKRRTTELPVRMRSSAILVIALMVFVAIMLVQGFVICVMLQVIWALAGLLRIIMILMAFAGFAEAVTRARVRMFLRVLVAALILSVMAAAIASVIQVMLIWMVFVSL